MRRVRLYATTLHFLPQPYPATAWRRGCREVHLPLIRVDEPAAELPWRSATLSQTACQRVEWLWWSPTVAEWSEWSAVVGVAMVWPHAEHVTLSSLLQFWRGVRAGAGSQATKGRDIKGWPRSCGYAV